MATRKEAIVMNGELPAVFQHDLKEHMRATTTLGI
jgi:hypothetical protein